MYDSSTILTTLSDEPTVQARITGKKYWFDFHVACLLFDSVPLSAAALLSNPNLRDLWLSSPEGASKAYSTGLVRPIIMGSNRSMTDVAEAMIARETVFRLGTSAELKKHAQCIDRASFRELYIEESIFRNLYAQTYERALQRVISERSRSEHHQDALGLRKIHAWTGERSAASELRASLVHRFLDTEVTLSPELSNRLKLLADLAFHEVCRTSLGCCLTVAELQLNLSRFLVHESEQLQCEGEHWADTLECPIPFERLANLPLMHVLSLRETEPFIRLRRSLHLVRRGEQTERKELRANLVECTELLRIYARELNAGARKFILDAVDKSSMVRRFRFHFLGAKLVGIGLRMTNLVMGAVGVGSDVLGLLEKGSQPSRYSLPEPAKGDVIVNVASGVRHRLN